MPGIRRRLARVPALASILLIILLVSSAGMPSSRVAAQGPPPQIEVDPQLSTALAADETTSYIISFDEAPDLHPAYAMSWQDRGRFVVKQLQATADRSQKRVRGLLKTRGARFQSFWAGNMIVVERSNLATVNALQSYSEITALQMLPKIVLFDAQPAPAVAERRQPVAADPNIVHIRAPDAWGMGYRGDGIVVGSLDTGVRYTHQALVNHYRGNQGGGSFDHNYNWWDPYGHSASPVDSNDHGSHTTGTMVGDDGGANRIGVAPGAQWIACMGLNGSSGSNAALLECGQFMLAPWNLSGASPNPDKRPQIVNNSWGSCLQSYDGWFQGVVDAWVAAGIYPVFSAGNAGNCGYASPPGLNTVGVPARYGNVTAVGSTGTNNSQYATHSNWGPTDSPDTTNPRGYPNLKPQVVAPGVNIRSAVRGSDSSYQSFNGTSMSAPQVAGTLALMWQAAPCLLGNYALSEVILEQSATPIPYATGNGDEGPGNVPNHATGWGEIDALAAVQQAQASCGTTGWAAGRVTDASTSQPLANVSVVYAAQSTTLSLGTQSDPQGSYQLELPQGNYAATAQSHGYYPRSDPVGIAATVTTTHDLPLTPIPLTIVSGTVRDSTHGWPLYAKISVDGYDTATTYTNPASGVYTVTLRQSQAYTFTVEAIDAGYLAATRAVTPPAGHSTQDFTLVADALCMAPGYRSDSIYLADFDGSNGGFSVSGSNASWAWGTPTSGPSTARSGAKVWATNLNGNYPDSEDSYLTSSPIDLSTYAGRDLYLDWWQWLQTEQNFDFASLEVSKNGGANWTRVYGEVSGGVDTTWRAKQVALDSSYAVANFQLRFHLNSDIGARYPGWYVDDVAIQVEAQASANQPPPCLKVAGALVHGSVTDRNTGDPVNGALVAIDSPSGTHTTTTATPNDPALDDGFFQFFVPQTGTFTLKASAPQYVDDTHTLVLAPDALVRQDLRLNAPFVSAPQTFSVVMAANRQLTKTLTLTNTGSASVGVDLQIYRDDHLAALNAGARLPNSEATLAWQQSSPLPTARVFHMAEFVDGVLYVIGGSEGSGTVGTVRRYTPATGLWDTTLPPLPTPADSSCSAVIGGDIYIIGGSTSGTMINNVQIFHTATSTWEAVSSDPLPAVRRDPSCEASGGKIYAFGGVNTSFTPQSDGWVYDPAAPSGSRWSPIAALPLASHVGGAVLANGLIFYAAMAHTGTPNPTTVYAYDPASNTWGSYPALQEGHGYGTIWALDGRLYVGGGYASSRVEAYELAQGSAGTWRDMAPLDRAYDSGRGVVDAEQGALYFIGGRVGAVRSASVARLWVQRAAPWLNLAQTNVAIGQQQTMPIPLSIDTTGLALGEYTAQALALLDRTPYMLAHPASTIRLIVTTPGLAAGPSAATRNGAPGSHVAHTLTITNSGSYTDTFSIAAGAHAWPATLASSVGPLAPGASATVGVSVAVPANALAGTSDSLALTVASGIDPQQHIVLTRTTTAGTIYGIGLEPAPGTRSGAPGTPVSYTLTLRNTGNTGDTFMVQLSGAQWPTQATSLNVQLAPGQTATIVVTVRIPATAAQQAEDNALVQVTSQGNSGVSAQVTLRTIAGWRKLYLPIIRR